MLGVTDLSTYLIGLVLIILLPGPNSLYVLSVAGRRGTRDGYRAACGVFLGDTVLMALAAGGVASLLQASETAFTIVKLAGAGYLAWLAYGLIRATVAAWRSRRTPTVAEVTEAAPGPPPTPGERPFRRALVISLLNPKAILFFVSFFVQFVDPAYAHPALSFLVLGAWAQFFSFCYLSTLIFAGNYLAATFRKQEKLRAALTGSVAAAFLGFAVKLAFSSAG
jgi:leucine efflux protein